MLAADMRLKAIMVRQFKIELLDFVLGLARATDLVSPLIANHHKRVAYIADEIALEIGFADDRRTNVMLAASVHDIGAFSLRERADTLKFDLSDTQRHAEIGYMLFKDVSVLPKIGDIIRYHHVDWNDGQNAEVRGIMVPAESHLLHLADRIDVLVQRGASPLAFAELVKARIAASSGSMFIPKYVDAFERVASREYFWFDMASSNLDGILRRRISLPPMILDTEGFLENAKALSHIIDYKSEFTSTHTAGVAACAGSLAEICGMPNDKLIDMRASGYLHDLGKLAIPAEVLEKRGRLSDEEFAIIKSHPYHTMRILDSIEDIEEIRDWAALHHEALDGSGYPFHLSADRLPQGSRIMAVADFFVAVTEDRPYRAGMRKTEVGSAFKHAGSLSKFDSSIVSALLDNYQKVDQVRILAQEIAAGEYHRLQKEAS